MPDTKEIRYKRSMLKAHIKAYIQRAINAGIPKRFLRIGPDVFMGLLSTNYHTKESIDKIVDMIYKTPEKIMKIPFIVIDGGSPQTRKMAAYAIMFRLIICDKFAQCYDCRSLVHKLNAFDARDVRVGERRTDLADGLKEIELLMINEFHPTHFWEHAEGNSYIDEVMDSRFTYLHPTIITYQEPPQATNDRRSGVYFADISSKSYDIDQKEANKRKNPSNDILRIRVNRDV